VSLHQEAGYCFEVRLLNIYVKIISYDIISYMKKHMPLLRNTLLVLCCVFPLIYGLRQVLCNDIWLHIRTGSWIWAHAAVPSSQLYSFMLNSKEWIDHEWLFQILVYPLYELAGVNGLIMMRLVIVSAILCIFISIVRKTERLFFISTSILAISVAASFSRWYIRPELFSLLFMVVFIYMLKGYKGKNSIFFIVPLQALWVNIHGYFIVGPVILFLFLLSRAAQAKLKLPFEWNASRFSGQAFKKLLLVFFLLVGVSLLNPYFFKGAAYPADVLFSAIGDSLSSSYAFSSVSELAGIPVTCIILNQSFSLLSATIIIFFTSLLLNLRKADIFDIILFISLLSITIVANRHIGMLALALGILTLFNLKNVQREGPFLWEAGKGAVKKLLLRVAYIVFTLFLIYNLFNIARGVTAAFNKRYIYNLNCDTKSFILGKDKFAFNQPFGAAQFLKENHVKANIFNFFNHGTYLIFALYPDCRVFIDGRTEVYGDTLLRTWNKIRRNPKLIDNIKNNLSIDCVVLPCAGDLASAFFKYLYNSKEWKLVFFNGKSSVFLLNNKRFKDITEKNEIKLDSFQVNPDMVLLETARKEKIYPGIFISTANFFYEIGMYDKGLDLINIAEQIMESNYDIHNLKAILLFKLNRPKESIEEFIKAINLEPENPEIYRNIGGFYQGIGKPGIAREYFEAGLLIDPGNKELKGFLESLSSQVG